MATTDLKSIFDRALVADLAERIAAVRPQFAKERFVRDVMADLPALELKARARRITDGLRAHLPPAYGEALEVLLASLGPDDGRSGGVEGFYGFRFMPVLGFVGAYGLDDPERSLAALHRMTRYFSAEFDIRPFILRHPEMTMARLHEWAEDTDWRVRRLTSEGTRPRLPWGLRLQPFVADPSPVLALLERLRAEPHDIVQRSVANNLNDIAKDHPAIVTATAQRWLAAGAKESAQIVRHGLRTLVKKGDPVALALLGFRGGGAVDLNAFTLSPRRLALGGSVTFSFELVSRERKPVTLSVDYAVHHRRADGTLSPKVFKLARVALAPGETRRIERRHAIKPITTRRYHPGRHRLEILVNGRALGGGDFQLTSGGKRVRR